MALNEKLSESDDPSRFENIMDYAKYLYLSSK